MSLCLSVTQKSTIATVAAITVSKPFINVRLNLNVRINKTIYTVVSQTPISKRAPVTGQTCFLAKKGFKNQYLVLASTNTKMTPQQIIQLYSRRWSIETYFKTAKQYLRLNKSQIQNYDGQVAQITITALTYILLAWQERLNKDDRTLGDLFYLMNDALSEIRFIEALVYLLKTLQSQETGFIGQTINQFMAYLPQNIQSVLRENV